MTLNLNSWTHNSLQADLAEYLRTTRAQVCWENFQVGPSGSPRPDVYSIPRSYSGFRPVSYECKVAVSDFRRDVTAGKWQAYLRFSCGVIFAAPAGLIDKADIPPGCGLMVRSAAGWRSLKGTTLRRLPEIPLYCWVKLLIDGIDREAVRTRLKDRGTGVIYRAQDQLRKQFGNEVAELVRLALVSRDRVKEAIKDAEAERRSIIERTHREVEYAAKQHAQEAARLDDDLRALANWFGLPPDAGPVELRGALEDARRRLVSDTEIKRLTQLYADLQYTLSRATAPLPGTPDADPTAKPQGTTRRRRPASAPRD